MHAESLNPSRRDPTASRSMRPVGLTDKALRRQNRVFRDTGGVSAGNRAQGFAPAFMDTQTGVVYRACFADGRPAPMHLLEGLPSALVVERAVGAGGGAGCGRSRGCDPCVGVGGLCAGDSVFYARTSCCLGDELALLGQPPVAFEPKEPVQNDPPDWR